MAPRGGYKLSINTDNPLYPSLIIPAGCGGRRGIPLDEPSDSIPPDSDTEWKPTIVYGASYGNYIRADVFPLDKTDVEEKLKRIPKGWQVLVIRDTESNSLLLVSCVDREREKVLFGDEKTRGIKRVEFCIPEIYRKMIAEGTLKPPGIGL